MNTLPKMSVRFALATALALLAILGITQFAQARFRQPNEEYQSRRAKLRAQIDAPLVIFGYTGHEDASEVAVFYQEPYFYYLTGHDEPGAALVLLPAAPNAKPSEGPQEILYLPERNLQEEQWEGPKMGPHDPGISEKTGFQAVEPFDNLKPDLARLAKTYTNFYTLVAPTDEEGYPHFTKMNKWLSDALPSSVLRDVTPTLDAMRQVKSPGELALMQKAIDLSVDAHLDAMRQMRPGLFEYQIAARMKEIHEWGGCEREAYAPIVGAGFNSTVLHYSMLDSEIKDGDVVVIDVGGEYGGYAADITRTLPANGKFTPRQREIYDIVLGAQNAAIDAIKPGAQLYGGDNSLQQIVSRLHQHARPRQRGPHARPLLSFTASAITSASTSTIPATARARSNRAWSSQSSPESTSPKKISACASRTTSSSPRTATKSSPRASRATPMKSRRSWPKAPKPAPTPRSSRSRGDPSLVRRAGFDQDANLHRIGALTL